MRPIRLKPQHVTSLAMCLLIVGLWQIGEGSWIYAKARLAQLLLQRAWSRSLAGETHVKPWAWADTWPVARLTVPTMRIDLIVLNGAYGRTLAFGPGYMESSAWPGTAGTTILSGHRDTHFRFIRQLHEGDEVVIQSLSGRSSTYRVRDRRILSVSDGKIAMPEGRSTLVLVTCYPFETPLPGGPLRYVVTAEAET